jgi:hypothetical protein
VTSEDVTAPQVVARLRLLARRPLARPERALVAVLIGGSAGWQTWRFMQSTPNLVARDFTYPWRAARALLDGQNPYAVIRPAATYPYQGGFLYPLPAAITVLPVAPLRAEVAGSVFAGVSAALLAYGLLRAGLWRLWAFASVAFILTLSLGQWGSLLVAGALLPGLGWVLSLKPTLGLALWIYRPNRAAIVGGLVLALVAFALVPSWPLDWWRAMQVEGGHPAPVTRPLGWIALLGLLRWRLAEARLLVAMACMPQVLYFYDQLPLWLIPWNALGTVALTAGSWIAWRIAEANCPDPYYCGPSAASWIVYLLYLPATVLVLCRPETDGSPSPVLRTLRQAARRLTGPRTSRAAAAANDEAGRV